MNLNQILNNINSFNTAKNTVDYELTEFFDKIGSKILNLGELKSHDRLEIIKSLFEFIKRQSSELEENWAFIHLIESIDKPTYKIYDKELIEFNKANPTQISILLLNRHTNSLEEVELQKGINLLKEISERKEIPKLVTDMAKEFYEYQLNSE